jgi:prepilin-type N-terminal cleavage/methylation domain-containing protein
MAASRTLARRLASAEDGFTLIEILVAILLLSTAVIALMGTFDHSRRTTSTAEAQGAAVQVAEKHLEQIAAMDYAQIGLGSAPGSALDPAHPNYLVTNSSPASFQYDPDAPAAEPLVTTGTVSNSRGTWGGDRLSGSVYAYVTWVNDTACVAPDPCSTADAAITQDYKRITVAVTADAPSPLSKRPVFVSTIVADPDAVQQP